MTENRRFRFSTTADEAREMPVRKPTPEERRQLGLPPEPPSATVEPDLPEEP